MKNDNTEIPEMHLRFAIPPRFARKIEPARPSLVDPLYYQFIFRRWNFPCGILHVKAFAYLELNSNKISELHCFRMGNFRSKSSALLFSLEYFDRTLSHGHFRLIALFWDASWVHFQSGTLALELSL